MENMENIYTASKPFYNLTKCLGLFPMSYDGPTTKGFFKVKWHDVLSSIISMWFCVLLLCLGLLFEGRLPSRSPFLSQVWIVHILVGNVFIFFLSFYQTAKYQSIADFLASIEQFDKKVIFSQIHLSN